ncbi:MAG: peroxiredoxin [Caulobacter sp. 12-67-6]|nr:MAG: peroxiredoxin [Caulobacter sp. 12-67-6]OYX67153.1 MAG: peroxiredoxin [Caulobacter sp. 32-67-35]OYX91476.1 MAG: peroxiredoxin [Caulobacter sp. 35-67-4]HQR90762.1 OsmC family protein [Caulobacter sp.]
MSTHTATISWALKPEEDFPKGRYSRVHTLSFDGGVTLTGSASPSVVPLPWSDPAGVDPEEMFVAALSACHMLTFLDLARRAGFHITAYADTAEGVMTKNDHGAHWVSTVTLRPVITWQDAAPSEAAEAVLHEAAHHACFIANSVRTDVRVEPALRLQPV